MKGTSLGVDKGIPVLYRKSGGDARRRAPPPGMRAPNTAPEKRAPPWGGPSPGAGRRGGVAGQAPPEGGARAGHTKSSGARPLREREQGGASPRCRDAIEDGAAAAAAEPLAAGWAAQAGEPARRRPIKRPGDKSGRRVRWPPDTTGAVGVGPSPNKEAAKRDKGSARRVL